MFQDFREYLAYLEKKGKLLRVKKAIDTRYEIAAGIRRVSEVDGPALLFENIKGFPGWRVVAGLYATQKLVAMGAGLPMDADEETILKRYVDLQDKCLKPKHVSTGPVKEIILRGDQVDLNKLPIPVYSALDSGPYLTAGVEIARHPDTGLQNVSVHRRMILSKDTTTIAVSPHQHLGMMIAAAEEKGQGLGVVTVMGVDPSLFIASQIKAPEGVDETEIAGAFRGAPLELVKCETIDAEIPANAEIAIEGKVIPGEKALDGPFGEYPGNYITLLGAPRSQAVVIKVTAITMRKCPIFQAMLTGMPMTENHFVMKWPLLANSYREITKIADVKAINATAGGGAAYHLVVSIYKKDEQEARKVMTALFRLRAAPKQVIVVDDDIDVYNSEEVDWAIATRVRSDKNIWVIPPRNAESGNVSIYTAVKLGIDATSPLKEKQWYQRVTIPGIESVDYL